MSKPSLEYPYGLLVPSYTHMKRLVVLLLLSLAVLAVPSRAEVELSFDFFHDELSPMGEWAEVDGYGYVWHPTGVDEDWAPYTDGYWTYTDAGWTWVSYEDWGGLTYHYGRWTRLDDYGWCWVPGYKWGPAWVSWRKNDDYVGWAPLPPECDWDEDRGVGVWVDSTYEIGPRYYSFCHTRDFGAPVLRHVLLPRIRNVEICFGTVNITSISYNRDYGCAFNGGFDYNWIRERCHRPVPALKLVQNTTNIYINGNRGNVFVNSPRGNALIVAAPRLSNRANFNVASRQVAVSRKFQRTSVTKGWTGLDKEGTRDRLLVKMREETKGLSRENAPARRVRAEELAVVPKTADFKAKPAALTKIPEERRNPATASQGDAGVDRKDRDSRPNRLDRDGDGRPDLTRGGSTEGGGVLPPGRGNGRDRAAEKPGTTDEKPAATAEGREPAGLRRRPGREGGQPDIEAPDKKPGVVRPPQPTDSPVAVQPGNEADQPGRRVNPRERGADGAGNNGAVEKARAARQERANENAQRAAEMKRDAQENAARENATQNAARENAERATRQRERAAEMQRESAPNNAAQENAQRQRAAEVEAARRNAQQAENAERAQAQRAQAQREAAQENTRRQAAERQNDNQRRMIQERQENAQRQKAAAAQDQQAEARARAAAANRERAMDAQREQAAEANRARAIENQQRAAAANRERAMDAQRQQAAEANRARAMENQQRAAQAQAQQRAAAQEQRAAQAQAQAQAQQRAQAQQQRPQSSQQERGRGRGKKGEE
jgi:hypothetical protein